MTVLEKRVVASNDDAFARVSDTIFSLTASFAVGSYTEPYKQYGSGARFTNITIPQGTTIIAAHLVVTVKGVDTDVTCNSKISAEDVDNAGDFSGDDYASFMARFNNHTTARISWAVPGFDTVDVEHNSPEIKTVIQEIVNRGSWVSGNALVLFWEDFDDLSTLGALRDAYSYDYSTTKCAELYIEYGVVAVGRSFGYIIG